MYVLHGIVMKVHKPSALVALTCMTAACEANILPWYYRVCCYVWLLTCWVNTIILTVAKVTLTLNQSQGRTKGFDLLANDSGATYE